MMKFFPNIPRSSAGLAPLCLVAAVASAAPAQALTWNFSAVIDGIDETVSGSFETDGTTPVLNQIYTITSITGSQAGVAITGMYDEPDSNTFQWLGSPSAIVTNLEGIYYSLENSKIWNLFNNDGAEYDAITDALAMVAGTYYGVSSSSLSPFIPAGVPGPLPLFGAGAAFGWSRRLRRRMAGEGLFSARDVEDCACPTSRSKSL